MVGNGVVIHNYTTTFEGSSITFTCEDGLFPNVTITATCTGEGHWSTDPATYMCINITGSTTGTTTTNTITTDSSSATINTTNIGTNTINHTAGEDSYCYSQCSYYLCSIILWWRLLEDRTIIYNIVCRLKIL